MSSNSESGLPSPRHDDGDPAEKRQHPRAPLGLLIQIRSDSIDEFKAVHCDNISIGGMFLRTEQRRPLGAELYFQFTLAGRGTLIEGLGQVVRVTPDGLGLKFISLLEPSASIIRHLVEERLAREV
jgi:Tfp pilus assembly protein PilZ